ncbi:MAG: glycosyltransferase family 2 protein [Bacteroidales bacterium]|nr:glycosyltransferase family 2 protein [Bacteroidales bacterium]
MNIHAYILCYNEEIIIKSVLNYYTNLCSKVFLIDNESTDNSVEIAKQYKNIEIISFTSDGLDDSLHVKLKTSLYKQYSRNCSNKVDWCICCDMDEILYHHDLLNILEKYQSMGIMVPITTGFDMVSEEEIDPSISIIKQYSKGMRRPTFDKRIVFNPEFDMAYSHGCHPYGPGFEYMKKTYSYVSSNEFPIALLHYKHIGSRLLNTAKKNLYRFNQENIKGSVKTGFTGPGSQYKLQVDRDHKVSPLLKKASTVLENNMVLFEKFEPATSDKSINEFSITDKLNNNDIGIIRDSAFALDAYNQKLALKLMTVASKLRKNGPNILNFIKIRRENT